MRRRTALTTCRRRGHLATASAPVTRNPQPLVPRGVGEYSSRANWNGTCSANRENAVGHSLEGVKAADHRFSDNLAEFETCLFEAMTWITQHSAQ